MRNRFKENYQGQIHYHEIAKENEHLLTLIQKFDSYLALFAIVINKASKENHSNYLPMEMDKMVSPLGSHGKCEFVE